MITTYPLYLTTLTVSSEIKAAMKDQELVARRQGRDLIAPKKKSLRRRLRLMTSA